MRSPVVTLFLVLLIAPAAAVAQEAAEAAPASASPASAPAPADAKARAPTKSRSIFGQAMAELTRSVEATRTTPIAPTNAQSAAKTVTAPTPAVARDNQNQVATHEPVE
jgi:hypothetical protein